MEALKSEVRQLMREIILTSEAFFKGTGKGFLQW